MTNRAGNWTGTSSLASATSGAFDITRLSDIKSVSLSAAWIAEQTDRAKNVLKYRAYHDGDHDATYLTAELRDQLRVSSSSNVPFAANYCPVVVQTMADRLELIGIRTTRDDLNAWIADVLIENRIDGLQHAVHEAAIIDGDTFVMVSFDNASQRVLLTHEHAYDGTSGMLVLYRSRDLKDMAAAFKLWQVEINATDVLTRINVYLPDRIERYAALNDGAITPYSSGELQAVEAWVSGRTGEPIGIPVVQYRNRGRFNYGVSEIAPAIPIQDAHNRTWYSLVLNSEYTGFPMLFALGFQPTGNFRPGSMITAVMENNEPPTRDQQVDLRRIEAGSNSEFLATAQYQEGVIGRITRTPSPEFVAPTASGEARKQAEAGLVGKVKRAQITFGNAWEDCIRLAWRIQDGFGSLRPPGPFERVYAQWHSAELRNDIEVVQAAVQLQPFIDRRTFLEMVAPVPGWDADKIDAIMAALETEQNSALNAALGALPNFGAFDDTFADEISPMNTKRPAFEIDQEETE